MQCGWTQKQSNQSVSLVRWTTERDGTVDGLSADRRALGKSVSDLSTAGPSTCQRCCPCFLAVNASDHDRDCCAADAACVLDGISRGGLKRGRKVTIRLSVTRRAWVRCHTSLISVSARQSAHLDEPHPR